MKADDPIPTASGVGTPTETSGPAEPTYTDEIHLGEDHRVRWWSLDRQGKPIDVSDPSQQLPRHAGSPPLDDDSPYTPSDYADPVLKTLPSDHLHVENGQITGIHAKGQLATLRLLLRLCLVHERSIVRLEGCRCIKKQVPLSEVLAILVS